MGPWAMEVTEFLGLRYLWIDALCIKQDDSIDLKAHMESMTVIYQSAKLTVVIA